MTLNPNSIVFMEFSKNTMLYEFKSLKCVAGRETIQLETFRVGALSLAGFLAIDGHR